MLGNAKLSCRSYTTMSEDISSSNHRSNARAVS
jgi:hypothetical protein